MTERQSKQCSLCKKMLSFGCFHLAGGKLRSECKQCRSLTEHKKVVDKSTPEKVYIGWEGLGLEWSKRPTYDPHQMANRYGELRI